MKRATKATRDGRRGPLLAAGFLLGVGLGGFVDGIVFHQILQWHNMLSNVLPPLDLVSAKVNMVWDGLFHAFTWITTAVGVALLFRAGGRLDAAWSGRLLIGAMLSGWGAFNVIEGVIDHHLLRIHHVRGGADAFAWDLAFLGLGAALILAGSALSSVPVRAPGWSRPSAPSVA